MPLTEHPDGTDRDTLLRHSPLFSALPEDVRAALVPLFSRRTFYPGECVMRQFEPGEALFLIASGSLKVVDERAPGAPIVLGEKHPYEVVGELSILTGETRAASAYAREEAELLVLARPELAGLQARSPIIYDQFVAALGAHAAKTRMQYVIRGTGLFEGLDEAELAGLETELELITVPSGDYLIQEGERSDSIYLVIGGRLRVVRAAEAGDTGALIEIARGNVVGEIGVLTGEPRSASIVATRDSLVARLPADGFNRLLESHPRMVVERIARPVISRLQAEIAGQRSLDRSVATIAVVAACADLPLNDMAAKLAAALAPFGTTAHLSAGWCDLALAQDGIAQSRPGDATQNGFLLWLSEQEVQHDFVVYEADPTDTPWTERCIRQADQLLIVAWSDAPPGECASLYHEPANNEHTLRRLVLLHRSGTALPRNTAAWLNTFQVDTHHHLRADNPDEFGRLARLVAGRGVGLVLSGGGARGFAHIGVVRALLEKGFPIDWIGGVSAGAMIGALFAMGLDPVAVEARVLAARRPIDYTLPIHALTTGRNWTRSMADLFGEVVIEDLWTPYFCLSANISQARLEVHTSGSLMRAVRASTAIPGYLPPVYDHGDVLVDGGLFNNIPVDVMKAQREIGPVIAVDVSSSYNAPLPAAFGYQASGWSSLWRRLQPGHPGPAMPSMPEILLRSITISNIQSIQQARRMADLYLRPPVEDVGLTDFDKISEIADLGYTYGRDALRNMLGDEPANPDWLWAADRRSGK